MIDCSIINRSLYCMKIVVYVTLYSMIYKAKSFPCLLSPKRCWTCYYDNILASGKLQLIEFSPIFLAKTNFWRLSGLRGPCQRQVSHPERSRVSEVRWGFSIVHKKKRAANFAEVYAVPFIISRISFSLHSIHSYVVLSAQRDKRCDDAHFWLCEFSSSDITWTLRRGVWVSVCSCDVCDAPGKWLISFCELFFWLFFPPPLHSKA